jgi:hypothetical protein
MNYWKPYENIKKAFCISIWIFDKSLVLVFKKYFGIREPPITVLTKQIRIKRAIWSLVILGEDVIPKLKNRPDNRQESVPVPNNRPTLANTCYRHLVQFIHPWGQKTLTLKTLFWFIHPWELKTLTLKKAPGKLQSSFPMNVLMFFSVFCTFCGDADFRMRSRVLRVGSCLRKSTVLVSRRCCAGSLYA